MVLSYRKQGGTKSLPKPWQQGTLKPASSTTSSVDAIQMRLTLDDNRVIQIKNPNTGKILTGKDRKKALDHHARSVRQFLEQEAAQLNETHLTQGGIDPLEGAVPPVSAGVHWNGLPKAGLGKPPRRVSGRRGLDRIAAYRRRRSRALVVWNAEQQEALAPPRNGVEALHDALVRALAQMAPGNAPSFAVSVTEKPSIGVSVDVTVGGFKNLPLTLYTVRSNGDGLVNQTMSGHDLAEMVRRWTLATAWCCADLLFLERGEIDRTHVTVFGFAGSDSDNAARLVSLHTTKGQYLFDLGEERVRHEALPYWIKCDAVPYTILDELKASASTRGKSAIGHSGSASHQSR